MSFRNRPTSEKDLFREILARLDDLERVPISPVQRRGDQIWYIDPTTAEEFILNPVSRVGDSVYYTDPNTAEQILLAPECPCDEEPPPTGPGDIWIPTGLTVGSSQWVSNDGVARALTAEAAESVTDSGIVTGVAGTNGGHIFDVNDLFGSLPSDTLTLDLDISTWWSIPTGAANFGDYEQFAFRWGANLYIFDMRDWDGFGSNPHSSPSPPEIATGIDSGTWPFVAINPATAGLSGWQRGYIRLEQNITTGDVELFAGPNEAGLVSMGTGTLTDLAGAVPWKNGDIGIAHLSGAGIFRPKQIRGVIHGSRLSSSGSGLLYEFTNIDIDAEGRTYSAGVEKWEHFTVNTDWRIGSVVTATPSAGNLTRIAMAPHMAPLWCRQYTDSAGPFEPIFDGGAALVDPAIAWSSNLDPATINITTGVQPTNIDTLAGLGALSGVNVWGVVDRASWDAGDLDANGWPAGWFPFGSTIS